MTTIELDILKEVTDKTIDEVCVGLLRIGCEVYLNIEEGVIGMIIPDECVVYKEK
jgi:hypothetical protein